MKKFITVCICLCMFLGLCTPSVLAYGISSGFNESDFVKEVAGTKYYYKYVTLRIGETYSGNLNISADNLKSKNAIISGARIVEFLSNDDGEFTIKALAAGTTTISLHYTRTYGFYNEIAHWGADKIEVLQVTVIPETEDKNPADNTLHIDSTSYIVSEADELLYGLPNGGVGYPHERYYYKKNDGQALFATCYTENNSDKTGYYWYENLLVSKDKEASLYYTTPVNWMSNHGVTKTIVYNEETWYYTCGAAMHVEKADEPKGVFNLNSATGVAVYENTEKAVIDLLDYYTQKEAEDKNAADSTLHIDSTSYIVSEADELLYGLPNGGVGYPYERYYYKKNDGQALFATCYTENNSDKTGYYWYENLLVSKDKEASLYYTTPVNWMSNHGVTKTIVYNEETWYYTYGAAMHVEKADEPKGVFNLNSATGVAVYENTEKAVIDLLDYYTQKETEDKNVASKRIVLKINDAKVYVDDEEKQSDVAPIIKNARTMVPVRIIAESFGATVTWDAGTKCVTIEKGDTVIKIFIDKSVAKINEKEYTLDSPAFINSGRTFVPIRFISEGFGAKVDWIQDTQKIIITEYK